MTIQVGEKAAGSDLPYHDRGWPGRAHDGGGLRWQDRGSVRGARRVHAHLHKNHLPGFVANADAIKAKGVDAIYVTSTNDVFVLDAWQKASGAVDKVGILADGSADFAKAVGLENDMSSFGMGMRTKRYSMIVKDGMVASLNVEDGPGKADVSGAKT